MPAAILTPPRFAPPKLNGSAPPIVRRTLTPASRITTPEQPNTTRQDAPGRARTPVAAMPGGTLAPPAAKPASAAPQGQAEGDSPPPPPPVAAKPVKSAAKSAAMPDRISANVGLSLLVDQRKHLLIGKILADCSGFANQTLALARRVANGEVPYTEGELSGMARRIDAHCVALAELYTLTKK